MSLFEHRKPSENMTGRRDNLEILRNALLSLESEPSETPRIADLKRILADRIADLETQRKPIS
jgi:hypothetical protein